MTLALGIGYTAMVITSGHNPDGLQGEPPLAWSTIWLLMKVGLAIGSVGCAVAAVAYQWASRRVESWLLWGVAITLGLSSVILFAAGARAYSLLGGDSGMRILWQLIQASAASTILLAGCLLLFGTRAGRVLLHSGVALVMFGQFYVSRYDIEEQVTIQEGQTASFARDIRQTELAIVDTSDREVERIAAIPRAILLASAQGTGPGWWQRLTQGQAPLDDRGIIRDETLPFGIKVLAYHKNASTRVVQPGEANPATAGTGLRFLAVPAKANSGADAGGQVDMAAAYVQLVGKEGSRPLGTYLVSQVAAAQDIPERVTVDGKTFEISLRFQQNNKPYAITLLDVRKDDYLGTSTPRNYSSTVRLVDRDRSVDREVRIWMNNPLRYAGETFYQSGYSGPPSTPVETTTLQVVTNSGWMIPYVACMIVVFGMGAQFSSVLVRFLRRRTEVQRGGWSFRSAEVPSPAPTRSPSAAKTVATGAAARAGKALRRRPSRPPQKQHVRGDSVPAASAWHCCCWCWPVGWPASSSLRAPPRTAWISTNSARCRSSRKDASNRSIRWPATACERLPIARRSRTTQASGNRPSAGCWTSSPALPRRRSTRCFASTTWRCSTRSA